MFERPLSFELRSERDGGDRLFLWLSGEIDRREADRIVEVLESKPSPTEVYIEMSGVTFVGSPGLSALIYASRQVEQSNEKVVLVDPAPIIVKLLDLCGLTSHFEIHLP